MELRSKHRFKGKEGLVCIILDDIVNWFGLSRDPAQVTFSRIAEIVDISPPWRNKRLKIRQ